MRNQQPLNTLTRKKPGEGGMHSKFSNDQNMKMLLFFIELVSTFKYEPV